MDSQKFIKFAIQAVVDYFNERVDTGTRGELKLEDVYVVWSCKTLEIIRRYYLLQCLMGCTTRLHTTEQRTRRILMHIRNGRICASSVNSIVKEA